MSFAPTTSTSHQPTIHPPNETFYEPSQFLRSLSDVSEDLVGERIATWPASMEAGRGSLLEATLAAVQPSPSSIPWRGESSDRGSEVRRAERGVSTLAGGVHHTVTDERDRDAALPTRGSRARVELVRRLPRATRRQKVRLKPTHRSGRRSVETSRVSTTDGDGGAHDARSEPGSGSGSGSTPEVVLARVKQVLGFATPVGVGVGKPPLVSPIKTRRIPLDEVGVVRKELVEPTKTHRRYSVPRDVGEGNSEEGSSSGSSDEG